MTDALVMPGAWNSEWENHYSVVNESVSASPPSPSITPPPDLVHPSFPRDGPVPPPPPDSNGHEDDYDASEVPQVSPAEEEPQVVASEVGGSPSFQEEEEEEEEEVFTDDSEIGEHDNYIDQENEPPIVIAVFGQTGTGKTSFIRAVTGANLQVGHGLTSCTEDVVEVQCRIENENVLLVDTPGFSDTNLSDTEILTRIADWMKAAYYEGFLLSGIIYLHRIIDPRMEGPSLKNLRMMKKLCGANSLRNVVLATTMWERVSEEEGSRREAELRRVFWKDMVAGGSTIARITTQSNADDARALVKSLLRNKPTSTQLQDELHSGKSLVETAAGTEIREEMAKLERKMRKEHADEMTELRRAQLNRDRELVRQITAAIEQSNQRIANLEAEKLKLKNATLKPLPKVKRKGFFGMGGYHCDNCGTKTNRYGVWTCTNCSFRQLNKW